MFPKYGLILFILSRVDDWSNRWIYNFIFYVGLQNCAGYYSQTKFKSFINFL